MRDKLNYTLYLVTDSNLMSTNTVEESVELALQGGATLVQLREKTASSRAFYETALRAKEATQRHSTPLIINDRVDIALAVDAEGVHLGQSDLPANLVRKLIGQEKILGVSVTTVSEALEAKRMGADYLGVGALYPTGTKQDAALVSFDELGRICAAVDLPVVVIGGINRETIPSFKGIGISGFAVVSALVSQQDIPAAARELLLLSSTALS